MLYKSYDKASRKTLIKSKPLLIRPEQGYSRPSEGRAWFATTTTVWRTDELIRRSVRDWRRLLGETGHTGERTGTMRADHDSVYTGTHSVFPAPLIEWILLRYAGEPGGTILDAFAGGPPRGVVATLMGYHYIGVEIRQEQIDENMAVLHDLGLSGFKYILADGRFLDGVAHKGGFDMGLSCPPYWNLERYSDLPEDLSNMKTYAEFNAAMGQCARAHRKALKPGAFMCIVTGPFRDKKGELIDFPGHTVNNFRDAGFVYHQQVVLSKNFASAAKRSTNSWKGQKLVPTHEFLLVFKNP
jgi:DNA modification methylase